MPYTSYHAHEILEDLLGIPGNFQQYLDREVLPIVSSRGFGIDILTNGTYIG